MSNELINNIYKDSSIKLIKVNKFWNLEQSELSFTLEYGKINKKNYNTIIRNFDTQLDKEKYIKKTITSKIKKGYKINNKDEEDLVDDDEIKLDNDDNETPYSSIENENETEEISNDKEFNQETEEELLDIPTFLRRQAN